MKTEDYFFFVGFISILFCFVSFIPCVFFLFHLICEKQNSGLSDFAEDPFKDYRYEDPFSIQDPFADETGNLSFSQNNHKIACVYK